MTTRPAMALARATRRCSPPIGCGAAASDSAASLLGLDAGFLDELRVLGCLGLEVRTELIGRAAHCIHAELRELLLDLRLLHDLDQVVMKLVCDRLGRSGREQDAPPVD